VCSSLQRVVLAKCVRFASHGFPVHPMLASAMNSAYLDTRELAKRHELLGAGFHLPSFLVSLVSFLASVEYFEDVEPLPWTIAPAGVKFYPVMQILSKVQIIVFA
jgi:hypothetical protein